MIRRLLGILGRRTILTFGFVTFLVGALLATVNITSRYALKLYVDDQLRRIPWDLAVYQQGAVGSDRTLHTHIAKAAGITRVESLAFLRARFPEGGEVEAQVYRLEEIRRRKWTEERRCWRLSWRFTKAVRI